MAENMPNLPGGATPPKPPEGAKVQPKKETVRINLPPKPSAAPTIKLPTLPAGGPAAPAGAPAAAPAAAAPTISHAAPKAAMAPATAGPASSQRPPQRPMPAPVAAAAVSTLDKVLAIVAMVAGLGAIGTTLFCLMQFKP